MRVFFVDQLKNILVRRTSNIYFFCRYFSNFKEQDPFRTKDPFKKKWQIQSVGTENDSRNSSRICITVFGNAAIGQPRCLGIFTEFKGYLFNCGENVGRYCREYGVNTCLIKHVFVTQRKWENLSGVSDIYLTNQTSGVYLMFLYGPPGVENILSMLSSKELDTQLIKKEGGYIDHTMKIDPVSINSEKDQFSSYKNTKGKFEEIEPGIVYSYICKIHEKPGDFLTEKCIEKGVPLGPDLLKLKNWEDVILPSGNTVYAKDVHGPTYPERILLIVDCPSESFLKPFVHEEKFKKIHSTHNCTSPIFVFHFTPSDILKSKDYQSWMNRFPVGTQHFILNTDNPNLGSHVVHQIEKCFNFIHPKIFRKLRESKLAAVHSCSTDVINPNCTYVPPMMQIHLRPKEEYSWYNVVKDHDNVNVTVEGEDIVKQSSEFDERLKSLKTMLLEKSLLNTSQSVYPEVAFLGTSSSLSTAYRNVTAILVNTSPNQSILLDCGEGSMMQFVRYFGQDVYLALQKLSCIFISHKHLDHYLGLFEVISQRIKAFKKANVPYKPVAVILPFEIDNIFMKFCEVFQNLYPAVRLFRCKYLSNKKDGIKKFIGNIELTTVPVKHCKDSWGIVLESVPDWKIVYSGDAAPCQSLIDAGKDCTLLIHEASIEDGLLNEALSKRHSTPSQVLDIATKMNAQHTILTHFSKRYKGFPLLPDCSKEMSCAFDFMTVQRCDLPLLPLLTPVIKCLFQKQLETYEETFSYRKDFENVFLKVLKS